MKKHIIRRFLAMFLAVSLVLSYISETVSYAAEFSFLSSEQIAEESNENSTTDTISDSAIEEVVENISAEPITEETIAEESAVEETTTEESTVEESVATENIPNFTEVPIEYPDTEINELELLEDNFVRPDLKKDINTLILDDTMISKLSSSGTILSAGSWGEGYYWYINNGAPLYVFCLDHGKTMYSGKYTYTQIWDSIYDPATTFRMAVALSYFKANGGLYSLAGYEDAQRAIWGTGGTTMSNQLIKYAYNLYELTEVNPSRASSQYSFTNITGISQTDAASQNSRAKLYTKNIISKKVSSNHNAGDYLVNNRTISVGGSAWKYFAAPAPNGWGVLQVVGCYTSTGKKLGSKNAMASIGTDGKIKVSFNQQEGSYGTKDKPIMIIIKADLGLQGATKINYLDCGAGKQRMSYDVNASSPAYFALSVYAESSVPMKQGATVKIKKTDPLKQMKSGAKFSLTGTDASGKQIYYDELITDSDEIEGFKAIEQEGTYTLKEVSPPKSMINSGVQVKLQATKNTTSNGTSITLSTVGTLPSGVSLSKDTDNMSFTYTIENEYASGDAYLEKLGNVLVRYENGQFVYEKRNLNEVSFDLYANEDIYLEDTLLWKANTKLTQTVLDESIWNKKLGYHASMDTHTDSNGEIHYYNLPLGKYYLIETSNNHNNDVPLYHVKNTRLQFDIQANHDTLIMGGQYINEAVPASCFVEKVDKESKEPLAGAEFTLYAHIDNTNFDGYPLFTVDDTAPAVIERNRAGQENIEENTWIPLKTVISDVEGIADFNLELPYGKYMVVETNPPEDYGFSEGSSYIFTHKLDLNNTYPNGANYAHIFENEKTSNFILIKKYGELLVDAKTITTDYGDYKQLNREELPVKDVTFEIYDEDNNLIETIKTDEDGIAKSGNLKAPATYTVIEKDNGGGLQLTEEPQIVVLDENKTGIAQIKELSFINHAFNAELSIYKEAEVPELSVKMPKNVSKSDSVYTYVQKPISGVVFGIYTKNDIANYLGDTIVAADSCVGYAVTDQAGIAVFTENLSEGDYYYKEILTADDTYIPDDTMYDFNIQFDNTDIREDLNREDPVINKKQKGSIQVFKKNGTGKIYLKGVQFNLLNAEKKIIGQFITDSNGQINITNLPVGTYYLQETKTKKGYLLDKTVRRINLTKSNLSQVIEVLNYKTPSEPGEPIIPNEPLTPDEPTPPAVHTGDIEIQLICIMLGISTIFFSILLQYRKKGYRR